MTVYDNRTTKKNHYKKSKPNIIYDHNSMSAIKKIRTKLNSRQIKSKQNSLTYNSLEQNGTSSQCDWLPGRRKSEKIAKRCKVKKNKFIFLRTINFTVINVIRYHLKSLKISFKKLHRKQLRHTRNQSSIAQNFKANGTDDYCNKPKRKQKSSKMYKYLQTSNIMKSRSKRSKKAEEQKFEAKTITWVNL